MSGAGALSSLALALGVLAELGPATVVLALLVLARLALDVLELASRRFESEFAEETFMPLIQVKVIEGQLKKAEWMLEEKRFSHLGAIDGIVSYFNVGRSNPMELRFFGKNVDAAKFREFARVFLAETAPAVTEILLVSRDGTQQIVQVEPL